MSEPIWLKAEWISGHAIIPDWPSRGGEQRVVCAEHAEAAIRRQAYEINELKARLSRAEHWAKHAMLMRSSQNAELLRLLRGEIHEQAQPT